jgi:hypothetical protein
MCCILCLLYLSLSLPANLVATFVQAISDGSLVTLVQRLRSQPQIITAYARDALIRNAQAAERLVAQLQQAKVISSASVNSLQCMGQAIFGGCFSVWRAGNRAPPAPSCWLACTCYRISCKSATWNRLPAVEAVLPLQDKFSRTTHVHSITDLAHTATLALLAGSHHSYAI